MFARIKQFATAAHHQLGFGKLRGGQEDDNGIPMTGAQHRRRSARRQAAMHDHEQEEHDDHNDNHNAAAGTAAANGDDTVAPLGETDMQRHERSIRLLLRGTTLRGRLFVLLEEPRSSTLAFVLHIYFLCLIVAGTFTFCLETITPLVRTLQQQESWFIFDSFIMCSWTIEFVLRLWCSPRYIRSWFVFVDFIAIIPFFLILSISELRGEDPNNPELLNNPWVRLVKLLRVLRLLKFTRASDKIMLLFKAIRRSTDGIFTLIYVMALATILFSSCMFYAELSISYFDENSGQYIYTSGLRAGEITPFQSVLDAFYWCVVTMTTVGYGDAYPSSTWGKLVAAITMISSMMILAFPATIIGANLTEVYQEYREERAAEILRTRRRREREDQKNLDTNHGIDNKVIEAISRTEKLTAESARLHAILPSDDLPRIVMPSTSSPFSSIVDAARTAADICEQELTASRERLEQLEARMTQLRIIISMLEINAAGGVGPIGLGGLIRQQPASSLADEATEKQSLLASESSSSAAAATSAKASLQQHSHQHHHQQATSLSPNAPSSLSSAPRTGESATGGNMPVTVFVAADEEQDPAAYELSEVRIGSDEAPLLKLEEQDME